MSDMLLNWKPRKISVADYHRMAETGILRDDERVELLDGLLVAMSPIGPSHKALHARITAYLNDRFRDLAEVGPQFSLPLGDFDEPEPDVVLLALRGAAYFEREPAPEEILAVIEIADSSITKDTGPKRMLYGRFGIGDYLVVDLVHRVLLRFTSPVGDRYPDPEQLSYGDSFALTSFPDIVLDADRFLPPRSKPA